MPNLHPGRPANTVRVFTEDNTFQHYEVLKRNRTRRTQYGEAFVEGVRPINLASLFGWTFRSLAYAGGRTLSDWARGHLASDGVREIVEFTPGLMARLSDREENSELIGIVELKPRTLGSLVLPSPFTILVADRISSPGNLGSLIRSCDAFGADAVVLSGHGADPFDPKTIRSSLGTVFGIPIVEAASNGELAAFLDTVRSSSPGMKICGSSAKGTTVVTNADLTGSLAIILGNETFGMSEFFRELSDEILTLPMLGSASSLNVAAAGTVFLYEVLRQRGPSGKERQGAEKT